MEKVGRNDPCPCGSGKKFKKCCELKTGAKKIQAQLLSNEDEAKNRSPQNTSKVSSLFFKTPHAPGLPQAPKHPPEEPINPIM